MKISLLNINIFYFQNIHEKRSIEITPQWYINWKYYDILPPGVVLGLGVLGHFGLKSKTRKIIKFIKILNYNKSLCINFCDKMS